MKKLTRKCIHDRQALGQPRRSFVQIIDFIMAAMANLFKYTVQQGGFYFFDIEEYLNASGIENEIIMTKSTLRHDLDTVNLKKISREI